MCVSSNLRYSFSYSYSHIFFFLPLRGDDQHDQLAVTYQLVLDNRAVSKATGETPPNIGAAISSSRPHSSFTMREGGVATPGSAEPQRPINLSTQTRVYISSVLILTLPHLSSHSLPRYVHPRVLLVNGGDESHINLKENYLMLIVYV